MKGKPWVWILYITLFFYLVSMFSVEVSMYHLLPPDQGGMSFWMKFGYVWKNSISFYGIIILLISLLFYLVLSYKRKHQTY